MLTQSGGKVNDLSPKLREDLQKKMERMAVKDKIKFKFDIARKNPDPDKTGGEYLFQPHWVLQPVTFDIMDPHKEKDKRTKIGLVVHENDKGIPDGFARVILTDRDRGNLTLDISKPDDIDRFAYLMLHPTLDGGDFQDKSYAPQFKYVDVKKDAQKKQEARNLRRDAMEVASNMTGEEEANFALAMGWDEDIEPIDRNEKISDFAEKDPEGFKKMIESSYYALRALVSRAESRKIINWLPAEYKYVWETTGEVMVAHGRQEGLNRLEKTAEWLGTDKKGQAAEEKLRNMLKATSKA